MADSGLRTPACPLCGTSDMSQATAAIVAGQTHVMHGSQRAVGAAWTPSGLAPVTMGGTFDSTHQSELARMLDLPLPRPASSTMGCLAAILLFLGVLLSGFGAYAVLANDVESTSAASSRDDEEPDALAVAIGGFMLGGLPLIVGFALAMNSRDARRRWRREINGWHRAAPIAARLVYCARDHIVYDPASPDVWLHPSQTAAYAYETAR